MIEVYLNLISLNVINVIYVCIQLSRYNHHQYITITTTIIPTTTTNMWRAFKTLQEETSIIHTTYVDTQRKKKRKKNRDQIKRGAHNDFHEV